MNVGRYRITLNEDDVEVGGGAVKVKMFESRRFLSVSYFT